ncbi:class I SAM-dependent methyltransferase [Synechococcus elongatus]|uniref:Methyltransferase domain-containing protein n=1 Tax=Synechococcus elongatus PCC 11801 TaxID=2219813 RepID=A0AAN1QP90_SYNEL|nr:methyltransferase domain-containing protein [Synechococcus elongatus]AZB73017.1 class I SAM-dependent methyltransferase [Synechococcus elongatus PCC 11801]
MSPGEKRESLSGLVAAIRREAAKLSNLEERLFDSQIQSSWRSTADIDSDLNAAIRAAENLAAARLSVRSSTNNLFKKICRKLFLSFLDRIERRRCQSELALLRVLQNLHAAQQRLYDELKEAQELTDQSLVRQFQHLQRQIDVQDSSSTINPELEKLLERFYCKFESEYRGSSDSVRHRLRPYRDRLTNSASPLRVVDLGCGRGEWLTLIRDLGHLVKGVDYNPEFVDICQQQKLQVELADAGAWLHSQSDQSVDVISAFHVIEHLPFSTLVGWIQQIHRILKPQGLLLLETPNISQFHVGLVDFYRDPTHTQKIHPQMIQTLLESIDFTDIETAYVDAHGDEIKWLPTDLVQLQDPGQYGSLPADLAIIARKAAEN